MCLVSLEIRIVGNGTRIAKLVQNFHGEKNENISLLSRIHVKKHWAFLEKREERGEIELVYAHAAG